MSYEKHTWVNNVDAVDEDKMNHIENGIANAVEKSGDTLTGELFFNNTDGYGAITKYRTVSGTNYSLALGLGANGATRLENRGGANDTSLEVRSDGIYNGLSGKKLVEEVGDISLTTNLESGRATAYRIGKIVIVTITGSKTLSAIWTDYTIITLNGVTAKDQYLAPIIDQNTGLCADMAIERNSNVIKINKRAVSSINQGYFRGQLIFVAN